MAIDLAQIAKDQQPGVELELALSQFPGLSKKQRGKMLAARRRLAAFVRGSGWSFDPRGCYVYLLWTDDDRCPLYVGRSTNLMSRLAQHRSDPEKVGVVRVQVIPCVDFDHMARLELQLIQSYQPPMNKVGKRL